MSSGYGRSRHPLSELPMSPSLARMEADAHRASQTLTTSPLNQQSDSPPSLQVPKIYTGQSLTLQQQHFHFTFACRLGVNVFNTSPKSHFNSSMKSPGIRSPQTEKMSKRSHMAALAIADRYLKQCQYYSRQYCTLRQHYLRPSLESSPAALVPSEKRSLTVFTFKTWFALVEQQRKQKFWDQQQRSSRLSRSFCKLRIWSLRSVREISSSAIIHKKLLDKHFFLWISRVRRRKFCIARVTVASEFQARTRKTSSFSNWSLVVRDSRRKHNVVLLRRQRLAFFGVVFLRF
jgi:hypothetical protein